MDQQNLAEAEEATKDMDYTANICPTEVDVPLSRSSRQISNNLLRLKNILTPFDDFGGHEILTDRDFQDYQSLYLNLYAEFRNTSDAEKESIKMM